MTRGAKILLFILVAGFYPSVAQVDTEFWFAPPEITSGHGDSPLFLRVSTLDQPATVTVSQPARANTVLATVQVAANTTFTIDLSQHKGVLETVSPAVVMKTGLKIRSTAPMTAYYEVGAAWNSDIFALKGRNALGNRFVIPAQNLYDNSTTYSPTPRSSFDIVATRNNTVVTVKPTRPLAGHEGDTLITIRLNAGETYSLRKVTALASDNAVGTVVESSKPIAITLKDDSVINGGCHDMLGDQLVPVGVAGNEYVVLKGFLYSQEYLFITAIEDDTRISFDGLENAAITLQAGEIHRHPVVNKATYIAASKPVYVIHITGFGCEMGMAILPSINCKGSSQIGFSRTTDEFFGLNVLVRREGIGNFNLNGSGSLVPASAFTPVPGTSDAWYTAQLSFSTADIGVGQSSLIANDLNSFQIGIINGDAATSCRYGYFSAFSTLFIGDDLSICEGETTTLDAGPGKETYLWSTGAASQQIDVNESGEYWVKVVREECELYDTIAVSVRQGEVELGPDVGLCPGEISHIDGKQNFSWLWSDGSTEQFLETDVPGKYWVSVYDYTGCHASDTVFVSTREVGVVDLGDDVLKCPEDTTRFDIEFPGATYLWSDGKTVPENMLLAEGQYWAKVFLNGCEVADTVEIALLPSPFQDTIYGSPSVCPFSEEIDYYMDAAAGDEFTWSVDGGDIVSGSGSAIKVNWRESGADASVKAVVTNAGGCRGDTLRYAVRVNPRLEPELPDGPDTVCLNKAAGVLYTTPFTNGSVYEWQIVGGEVVSGQGGHEVLIDWLEGVNTLRIRETSTTIDTVCQGDSPELKVLVFSDSTTISLGSVSIDTANSSNVIVTWDFEGSGDHSAIELRRSGDGGSDWATVSALPPSGSYFVDEGAGGGGSLQYFAGLSNACDEEVNSIVHETVFLTATADTVANTIAFSWNHYQGWVNGVASYELWRRLDDSPGLNMLKVIPPSDNHYIAPLATDGFTHEYFVRARERSGVHESWSSPVSFEFEHRVFIPNIITPNGDEYNEYFLIKNLHLYRGALLTIYDRWGKTVFRRVDYQGDWNAEGLGSGVYFYTLYLGTGRIFKGTLSVRR